MKQVKKQEAMTEGRLEQYRATLLEIEQLENRLKQLHEQGPAEVTDTVSSAAEFPFSKHTVAIEGLADADYFREERRLKTKLKGALVKAKCEESVIEGFIQAVPDAKIRVILRYRYIHGKGWQEIANRLGWCDESAPRQKIKKFLR